MASAAERTTAAQVVPVVAGGGGGGQPLAGAAAVVVKAPNESGFYQLTSPKPHTSKRIAVVHFAKELGLQVPPSSLCDEHDLIIAITSSAERDFPTGLFNYFTVLKIHSTLPSLLPGLVSVLQENAKLGSLKALRVLGLLLPVLRLLAGATSSLPTTKTGEGAGSKKMPPNILPDSALDSKNVESIIRAVLTENSEDSDASNVVDLAASYLLLGLPYRLVVQPTSLTKTFSLVVCRQWEKWNYQAALMIVHWALEALEGRLDEAYPSDSNIKQDGGAAGAGLRGPESQRSISSAQDSPRENTRFSASKNTSSLGSEKPVVGGGEDDAGEEMTVAGAEGTTTVAEGNQVMEGGDEEEEGEMTLQDAVDAEEEDDAQAMSLRGSRAQSPREEDESGAGARGSAAAHGAGKGTSSSSAVHLCFPTKLPATASVPGAAIITSLILCARGLHKQIVVQLSVWCLRSLKNGVLPMACALALNRIITDHPSNIQRLVFEGLKFYEAVIVGCLSVAVRMLDHGGALNASSACQGVIPLLRLALVCTTQQAAWGILLGKDAQQAISDSLNYVIRWYLALVPYVNPLADDGQHAASGCRNPIAQQLLRQAVSTKSIECSGGSGGGISLDSALALPVRLVLSMADVSLHDYKSGPPEYIRSMVSQHAGLFRKLYDVDCLMHETKKERAMRRKSKSADPATAAKKDDDADAPQLSEQRRQEGNKKEEEGEEDDEEDQVESESHFLDLLETFLFISDPTSITNAKGLPSLAGLLPASAAATPVRLTAPMARWGLEYSRNVVASNWITKEVAVARAAPTSNLVRIAGSHQGAGLTFGGMDYLHPSGSRAFPLD